MGIMSCDDTEVPGDVPGLQIGSSTKGSSTNTSNPIQSTAGLCFEIGVWADVGMHTNWCFPGREVDPLSTCFFTQHDAGARSQEMYSVYRQLYNCLMRHPVLH